MTVREHVRGSIVWHPSSRLVDKLEEAYWCDIYLPKFPSDFQQAIEAGPSRLQCERQQLTSILRERSSGLHQLLPVGGGLHFMS